eukprot:TRINITY_DN5255_c0_g1_i8.p1 TRINITY_DN5255_c0_g1~~TRINITY_DN5255_c0_g1_i8.p1  ORF type:complete len:490 (+),score=105.03 TRINITY_DN5255_c0_g1_i8:168-1637(+)
MCIRDSQQPEGKIDNNQSEIGEEKKSITEDQYKEETGKLLNWKKYLYDEKLLAEVIKFENWDQNLEFDDINLLKKDLARTRQKEPHFRKPKIQNKMQLIATFYCKSKFVNYQQGMLELVVPFLLLQNKDFKLSKCYAYFSAFMDKYFPQFLIQRKVEKKIELPHVSSAISFCEILLQYHNSKLYQILQQAECDLSISVTQWIMTFFAKDTAIELTYVIIDQFMRIKNPNFIFFLAVALILLKQEQIYQIAQEDLDELIIFFNKSIKSLTSEKDIMDWFEKAKEIYSKTPQSFEDFISYSGFNNQSIMSQNDIIELKSVQSLSYLMPIQYKELQNYQKVVQDAEQADSQEKNVETSPNKEKNQEESKTSGKQQQQSQLSVQKNIKFVIIDLRTKIKPPLANSYQLKVKPNQKNSVQVAEEIINNIGDDYHICFVIKNFYKKDQVSIIQQIVKELRKSHRNYLAILLAGGDSTKNKYQKKGLCIISQACYA